MPLAFGIESSIFNGGRSGTKGAGADGMGTDGFGGGSDLASSTETGFDSAGGAGVSSGAAGEAAFDEELGSAHTPCGGCPAPNGAGG